MVDLLAHAERVRSRVEGAVIDFGTTNDVRAVAAFVTEYQQNRWPIKELVVCPELFAQVPPPHPIRGRLLFGYPVRER